MEASVVQLSYGATMALVLTLLTLVVLVGPGFFFLGRLQQRVTTNESQISRIFKKLDEIHYAIKNGGRSK